MSKVQWIVANELGSDSDINLVIDVIKNDERCIFSPVTKENVLTPSFIPEYDSNIPTIFYGPTNFIDRMSKLNYFPGVVGNNEIYSYENLYKSIPGEYFLNGPDDSFIGGPEEILNCLKNNKNDLHFFRPNYDNKLIIGMVRNKSVIESICENILEGRVDGANKDTKFLISKPYGISTEYRLFIVDGKIISTSQYFPTRKYCEVLPSKVNELAEKVIKLWTNTPWYILDICMSNNNSYIMELQNFHSAGFYKTDIAKIITSVNEKAISMFGERK